MLAVARPETGAPPMPPPTEDAQHLANRLVIFGAVAAAVAMSGALAIVIRMGIRRDLENLSHPGFIGLVCGGICSCLLLFSRKLHNGRSDRLRALEVAVTIVASSCFAPLTHLAQDIGYEQLVLRFGVHPGQELMMREHGALAALFSSSTILALRAALVPSSALRTGLVHAILTIPLLGIGCYGWLPWGEPLPLPFTDRIAVVMSASTWWLRTSIVCVATSFVMHRMRGEVRDARALGQYVLDAKLGSGGMGSVYRAQHAMLKRPMAVKLLDSPGSDALAVARFEREARLTASLVHPNTIHVYDFGRTPEGRFYYAMELLDGLDLCQLVECHGPQPPARVLHVLECVCWSLHEAHSRGLVHRDIKPANVFVCRDYGGVPDFVKVLDFGLARETTSKGPNVTQVGTIAGTPMYMAPEVLRNTRAATPKSDLYAVGALGYFLLSGHEIFSHDNVAEIVSAQLHQIPALPSKRLGRPLPPELEDILMACLDKDPARRPRDAAVVAELLAACGVDNRWSIEERAAWWAREEPVVGRPSVNATAPTLIVVRDELPRSRKLA